ncbi:MAG: hypothetical protein RLZZ511_3414 [Cyanobacteriota bacterium]
MVVIKIPKQYLIGQDADSITIDIPDNLLVNWEHHVTTTDQVRKKLAALNLTEDDIHYRE